VFHQGLISVAHVGDSRLYRLRDDELVQITSDHSLRQRLIDKNFYTEEKAKQEVSSNIVTRALGAEETVKVLFATAPTMPEDLFPLCSDGLSAMVEALQIHQVLNGTLADLEETAKRLVATANDNGERDNISVVRVRVEEQVRPIPTANTFRSRRQDFGLGTNGRRPKTSP